MSEELYSNLREDLFAELKQIRERKNISLKSISEDTRISESYLEALEAGKLEAIPKVYDKMFFRAYLEALKVDVNAYFERYLKFRNEFRQDKTTIIKDLSDSPESERKKHSYKNYFIFIPIVVAVVIIWLLIKFTQVVEDSSPKYVEEIKVQDYIPKVEEKPTTPSPEMIKSGVNIRKLMLEIKGIHKTWLRAVVDQKDTSEYLMLPGNKTTLEAENLFEFLIGRADGIQMKYSGAIIGPFGDSSQVVRYLAIDSSGVIAQKVIYPSKNKITVNEQEN